MTLPANSTFLPVLDDLLSPDLRPILQTPTADFIAGNPPTSTLSGSSGRHFGHGGTGFANVTSTNGTICREGIVGSMTSKGVNSKKMNFNGSGGGGRIPEEDLHEASKKIQTWWRNRRCHSQVDIGAERAKHSIRHKRTEEHIHFLETEVNRLKSVLLAERKLRSLQVDAIRSLWSQVQKMSSCNGGEVSIMTQSMPNGILASPRKKHSVQGDGGIMSMSFTPGTHPPPEQPGHAFPTGAGCSSNCSKEIQLLRDSMSKEISQLRDMITSLGVRVTHDNLPCKDMDVEAEEAGDGGLTTTTTDAASQRQRPFSLNIVGMAASGSNRLDIETPEITEYADEMARRLLEKAVD